MDIATRLREEFPRPPHWERKYGKHYNAADELCISDPMFTPTGERIVWKHPHRQYLMSSWVYTPTEEAKSWDGVPMDSMAAGSSKGGFFYIGLKRTGRTLTTIPHTNREQGYRAKALFGVGSSHDEDKVWVDVWLIPVTYDQLAKVPKF